MGVTAHENMNYPTNEKMVAELTILLSQIVGGGNGYEAVDISSDDHTSTMTDCRFVSCTSGTVIYIDFVDDYGVTQTNVPIPAEPRVFAVRKVTKVYQTGTDATNISLWR